MGVRDNGAVRASAGKNKAFGAPGVSDKGVVRSSAVKNEPFGALVVRDKGAVRLSAGKMSLSARWASLGRRKNKAFGR